MAQCWIPKADFRPTADDICAILETMDIHAYAQEYASWESIIEEESCSDVDEHDVVLVSNHAYTNNVSLDSVVHVSAYTECERSLDNNIDDTHCLHTDSEKQHPSSERVKCSTTSGVEESNSPIEVKKKSLSTQVHHREATLSHQHLPRTSTLAKHHVLPMQISAPHRTPSMPSEYNDNCANEKCQHAAFEISEQRDRENENNISLQQDMMRLEQEDNPFSRPRIQKQSQNNTDGAVLNDKQHYHSKHQATGMGSNLHHEKGRSKPQDITIRQLCQESERQTSSNLFARNRCNTILPSWQLHSTIQDKPRKKKIHQHLKCETDFHSQHPYSSISTDEQSKQQNSAIAESCISSNSLNFRSQPHPHSCANVIVNDHEDASCNKHLEQFGNKSSSIQNQLVSLLVLEDSHIQRNPRNALPAAMTRLWPAHANCGQHVQAQTKIISSKETETRNVHASTNGSVNSIIQWQSSEIGSNAKCYGNVQSNVRSDDDTRLRLRSVWLTDSEDEDDFKDSGIFGKKHQETLEATFENRPSCENKSLQQDNIPVIHLNAEGYTRNRAVQMDVSQRIAFQRYRTQRQNIYGSQAVVKDLEANEAKTEHQGNHTQLDSAARQKYEIESSFCDKHTSVDNMSLKNLEQDFSSTRRNLMGTATNTTEIAQLVCATVVYCMKILLLCIYLFIYLFFSYLLASMISCADSNL